MQRSYNRATNEIRPMTMQAGYLNHPMESVVISAGETRVLCAVSVVPGAPRWKKEQDIPGGWVTSEYGMMPGSTDRRKSRPGVRPDGRSQEIQRLIGRSLRAVVDMEAIGPNSYYLDCDVLDADGGTRCASISGAALALRLAFNKMQAAGELDGDPMSELLAAVSVGIVDGTPVLDLDYNEDSAAEVDMNVVMTESGRFVEIQGTAEENPYSRDEMNAMLDLAAKGIQDIIAIQKEIIANS